MRMTLKSSQRASSCLDVALSVSFALSEEGGRGSESPVRVEVGKKFLKRFEKSWKRFGGNFENVWRKVENVWKKLKKFRG